MGSEMQASPLQVVVVFLEKSSHSSGEEGAGTVESKKTSASGKVEDLKEVIWCCRCRREGGKNIKLGRGREIVE